MRLTLLTRISLGTVLCLILAAAASTTAFADTCPATDLAGFPLGPQPPSGVVTANVLFCSFPAFAGENPNDFFCTYNNTTAAIVTDNDAGFCPATAGAAAGALTPPSITKAFGVPTILLNGVTTVTFEITNPNTSAIDAAFADALTGGLQVASTPDVTDSCAGGTVTANAGDTSIAFSDSTLPQGVCDISVNVQATAPGQVTNTVTIDSTAAGVGGTGTATLLVVVPDAFQVGYAANLDTGDSVIDITNNGASSTTTGSTAGSFGGGNLCVNIYTFDPGEELLSCCSCQVTPNGLDSISVDGLLSNTLTGEKPTSVVVKLVATNTTGAACNAAAVTSAQLASGLRAWGTTLHALPLTGFGVTENRFSQGTLSAGELNHLTSFCAFIQDDGSASGICGGCATGGLGAATHQ